jgi:hypothetical protein
MMPTSMPRYEGSLALLDPRYSIKDWGVYRLSPFHQPFHQPARNGKTELVYRSSKAFPLRRAIAPKYVASVVGVIDQRPHNCEADYACDNCLARLQDIIPFWLFHRGFSRAMPCFRSQSKGSNQSYSRR